MFENATMKAFERGEEGKGWGGMKEKEREVYWVHVSVSQWNLFEQIRYDNENYHFS
jgi:hypothetical protein